MHSALLYSIMTSRETSAAAAAVGIHRLTVYTESVTSEGPKWTVVQRPAGWKQGVIAAVVASTTV